AEIRVQRALGGAGAPAALEALEQRIGEDRPAGERTQVLVALAEAHARLGDPEKAQRLINDAVAAAPDDLTLRLAQYDLAMLAGDVDEKQVETLVGEIRRIEGEDGIAWRYAGAMLKVEQAEAATGDARTALLAEARALLDPVKARRP